MRPNFTAFMVAVGLCLIVTGTSMAASTQTTSTGVSLWRGTGKLSDSSNRVVDPATGTLTALTPENCPGIRDRIIQRDALTRTTGTATYRCQVDLRAVVTFIANPTCPSLPPPEGRVVECLDGYTGAYTQTRSYTAAPYPTCAVLGEWTPTEPPAGACTPVSTEQWTLCAMEWGFCSFSGTRTVRYGAGSTWIQREIAATNGGVQCRNSVFGDPAPGITKRCELLSTGTTTPSGTASLSWTPPTQNTDGTNITNLAGYRIHYGTSQSELTQTVQIDNAGVSAYTIGSLAPGTYYFAVRALASSGAESYPSNVVPKVVQ
jgi:hypothetical protein